MLTRLESTKRINQLKVRAIKNGGYTKHMTKIIAACEAHKLAFGNDLTPNQF